MTCQSCGRPTDGGPYCAGCAARYKETWVDPYASLSTPPAQGRSADPYAPAVPWQGAPPPPPKRPYWLVPVIVGVSTLLVAGIGMWLLFGRGESATEAEPLDPVTTAPTAVATPEVSAEPSAPATVFVTVEPSTAASQESGAAQPSGDLSSDEAVGAMNTYLQAVAGDPAAGWDYLTARRQQIEDRDSYAEYWSSVSSASVPGCAFDAGTGKLSCDLTTVDGAGATSSSQATFWLTRGDDGRVLIDVAGGSGADQLAAEEQFQRYREQFLPLTYDNRWVAELSAKRPGISDPLQTAANGTHVFYLTDILAMHEDLVARFPGTDVLALRRADWGKQGRDLWQSVADPGNLTSEADAEAWCAAAFPELQGDVLDNQCTPRQMSAPHS